MNVIRVVEVLDVWFSEGAPGGNALKLRSRTKDLPHAFWADIALDRPRRMRFERAVCMGDEGVYHATESRPDVCWIAAQNEPLVKLRMMPVVVIEVDSRDAPPRLPDAGRARSPAREFDARPVRIDGRVDPGWEA